MKVGDRFEVKSIVTAERTAAALGSGGLNVLATPYMAALMESAAYQCLQSGLPDGKSSVGTALELSHVSPTPVGMEVRAAAELTDISENGRIVSFKVTAFDEAGLIGEGVHRRAIVDIARFMGKCQGKLEKEN